MLEAVFGVGRLGLSLEGLLGVLVVGEVGHASAGHWLLGLFGVVFVLVRLLSHLRLLVDVGCWAGRCAAGVVAAVAAVADAHVYQASDDGADHSETTDDTANDSSDRSRVPWTG